MSITNWSPQNAGQRKAAKPTKRYMGINVMWIDRISDRENYALQRQQ